jgi:hypothetical protein
MYELISGLILITSSIWLAVQGKVVKQHVIKQPKIKNGRHKAIKP